MTEPFPHIPDLEAKIGSMPIPQLKGGSPVTVTMHFRPLNSEASLEDFLDATCIKVVSRSLPLPLGEEGSLEVDGTVKGRFRAVASQLLENGDTAYWLEPVDDGGPLVQGEEHD